MKKLLTVFGVLLGCSSVFCHAAEDNKMKMITYFPVPYVAYSQVQVSEQMDVGLNASCKLNLGCLENTSSSLDAKSVNLKKGKLLLRREGYASGYLRNERTSIGSGNGTAEVDFDSLLVDNLNDGLSIQANTFSPSTLKLFPAQAGNGSSFPVCSGERTISWQKLKLKDEEEVYLVCGEPEQLPCSPTNNGQTTYTESCGPGYTGSITYTWNTSTCKYDKKDTCEAVEPEEIGHYGVYSADWSESITLPPYAYVGLPYAKCWDSMANAPDNHPSFTSLKAAAYNLLKNVRPGDTTPNAADVCKAQCGEDTPCEGISFHHYTVVEHGSPRCVSSPHNPLCNGGGCTATGAGTVFTLDLGVHCSAAPI